MTLYWPSHNSGICQNCGFELAVHDWLDIIGSYGCPAQLPLVPPRPSVDKRTCRKCKNVSLRKVQLPDTLETVAMCRYCGTTEEL